MSTKVKISIVVLIVALAISGAFAMRKPSLGVYRNQYLSVPIPDGWTASAAGDAVNITKGNYILYINPHFEQASGVEGGRFAEIAQGAPSADAVIRYWPSDFCGIYQNTSVVAENFPHGFNRVDYIVSKNNTVEQAYCDAPSDGSQAWYFSRVSETGYVNYYAEDKPLSYVITMAYNSKDVDALPKPGSSELTTMLDEMTRIITTLKLKQR